MLASEYIAQLQELIDTYGDRDLWTGSDDEGNSFVQPYAPQIGYVDNRYVDQHVLDSDEITTNEEDISERWRDDLEDGEYDALAAEREDEEAILPDKDQLKKYIDTNYKLVFVS